MSDFIEAPHSELSHKGNAFKVGHLVDHRFYCSLHGRGFSLFNSSVNRTLGLVPLENQCKEARGRANTIHDVEQS
jgi:hypothetical protein